MDRITNKSKQYMYADKINYNEDNLPFWAKILIKTNGHGAVFDVFVSYKQNNHQTNSRKCFTDFLTTKFNVLHPYHVEDCTYMFDF